MLESHINELSDCTGVIGDKKRLKQYVDRYYQSTRNSYTRMFANADKTRYVIDYGDEREIQFALIQTIEDLYNKTFRKYV